MGAFYEKILSLCGFDQQEIAKNTGKLRRACEKFGIDEEQVAFAAEKWIPQNYDLKLEGIRKLIGVYIREFLSILDLSLDKNDNRKIVYGTVPSPVPLFHALKDSCKEGIYTGAPDFVFMIVLNSFFHWRNIGLERLEEQGFTQACRHCALNKMRAFIYSDNYIPSPDIVWTWGTACDEAPKTEEFIQFCYGKQWFYVSTKMPHDTCKDEQGDKERITYLARQIQDAVYTIEQKCRLKLSQEAVRKAMYNWGKITAKIYYLNTLIANADPVPLGGNELSLINSLQLAPLNIEVELIEESIDIIIKEVKERIRNAEGILPRGAPRLGCYLVPFCLPHIVKHFERAGVALTFNTCMMRAGIPDNKVHGSCKVRDNKTVKHPYEIIAGQWLSLPLFNNVFYEAKAIAHLLAKYKNDGLILGFFTFDRWLGAHQNLLKIILKESIAKPVFIMEANFWDERFNNKQRIINQIESIGRLLEKA